LNGKLGVIKNKLNNNLNLFNSRRFHPSIVKVSKKLFVDGSYSQSIFEACKQLIKNIQKITGLTIDGRNLMLNVFNIKSPRIKLNDMITQSDKDEQQGFMDLFTGTIQGIRNPKGHEIINLKDSYKALEYLSLLSLLFRRLDERKL